MSPAELERIAAARAKRDRKLKSYMDLPSTKDLIIKNAASATWESKRGPIPREGIPQTFPEPYDP
jgi:hypothetical protein